MMTINKASSVASCHVGLTAWPSLFILLLMLLPPRDLFSHYLVYLLIYSTHQYLNYLTIYKTSFPIEYKLLKGETLFPAVFPTPKIVPAHLYHPLSLYT